MQFFDAALFPPIAVMSASSMGVKRHSLQAGYQRRQAGLPPACILPLIYQRQEFFPPPPRGACNPAKPALWRIMAAGGCKL